MKQGWKSETLGSIFEIGSSKRVLQKQWKTEGVPFYRAREIVRLAKNGSVENDLFISEEHFRELKDKHGVPSPGDLMVSAVGTLGACYVVQPNDRFYFKDASVLRLHPKVEVCSRFYQYAFQWDGLLDTVKRSEGATVGTLTISRAKGIPVPLPPVEEQRRIVAVLDKAFEGLARARTNAETNLTNARELFETSLSAFIDRHKDSWSSTTLGEAYDVRDGTHDSPKYHATGRALITSKNLGRDGLHFEKVKYISEEDYVSISRRSGVDKGDVLFAMIGTIGNPIVVDVEPDFAIKNVALFKMKEGRNGQFLRYVLRSKYVVEKMHAEAKGTTQQFVGLGYLRSFPVMLPEPIVESTMVDELDRIEAQCRSAEALYEIKIQDLYDLRQSLLQKAFAGELT